MGYIEQAADHLSSILEVMKNVENVSKSASHYNPPFNCCQVHPIVKATLRTLAGACTVSI
jgi:hypothetical protein